MPLNPAKPRIKRTVLVCIECGRAWLDGSSERWRLKITPDYPPETVAYCAKCAQREFG
jgi:RNase P subunit RPR2